LDAPQLSSPTGCAWMPRLFGNNQCAFLESWRCALLPFHAATANCDDAVNTYTSVISDVSDAIQRYTRCLSSSNGRDDCSSEFRKLKNAQSDFESAVSKYESECD
jgi:hypothetical protein